MPSSRLIWLLAVSVLCLTELFLPSAFVAFMMGISALIVGLLSYSGTGNRQKLSLRGLRLTLMLKKH